MKPDSEPLVIHSSVRGLVMAGLAPLLLVLAGIAGVARHDVLRPTVVGVFGFAGLLAFVAMWDYPRRCEFDSSGVVRVCAGRRHHISWEDVVVIRRARGSVLTNLRSRRPLPGAFGGLTAKVGRRPYLLVDQAESAKEHDELLRCITLWAPDLPVSAPRPPARTPPSDLYRRKKWS